MEGVLESHGAALCIPNDIVARSSHSLFRSTTPILHLSLGVSSHVPLPPPSESRSPIECDRGLLDSHESPQRRRCQAPVWRFAGVLLPVVNLSMDSARGDCTAVWRRRRHLCGGGEGACCMSYGVGFRARVCVADVHALVGGAKVVTPPREGRVRVAGDATDARRCLSLSARATAAGSRSGQAARIAHVAAVLPTWAVT
jgi:hypothetical protein